jgi:hypothetical protein
MRRIFISAAALVVAAALATGAGAEVVRRGNLIVHLDGDFSPHALPRDHLAPVKVQIKGRIGTTDGTPPPPLRTFEVALNRHGRLSAVGLRRCQASALQSVSTKTALSRCRGALVGHGSFQTVLSFGSETHVPASGPVLVFNSGRDGRPALLLHFYITTPVEATLVLPLRIRQESEGSFGTTLRTRVPKLAGGIGSITGINLTIGRTYSYRGKRHGYLLAGCEAPEGFPGATFPFLRGSFSFTGDKRINTTVIRNCQVR